MELLSAGQMRALEAESGIPGSILMERAGAGCVGAVTGRPGRALVFCGPGNNGGDGYVIARLLAARGWAVSVRALAEPQTQDAQGARAKWRGAVSRFSPETDGYDLVIDALFGGGLTRDLDPGLKLHVTSATVLAVDGPSGLCLDSGRDRGVVAPADLTVTFQCGRLGHHLGAGPGLCGQLVIADIGLSPHAVAGSLRLAAPSPRLAKAGDAHKYDHGHALMLAGGSGRGGAARLAARAALRVGAGLTTLGAPGSAMMENACRLDAVMLRRVDGAAGLADVLGDARFTAVGLGPGLGLTGEARALTLAALSRRRCLLDADALTLFADDPQPLFDACAAHPALLTPHEGEFRRLFPDLVDEQDRIAATKAAAARAGAAILRKGRATVIAAPDGRVALSSASYGRAAPWLATAGSGDVLAGIALGLMARGFDPFDAGQNAAWLHVEAARRFGPGLIAEDIVEAIPLALAAALG